MSGNILKEIDNELPYWPFWICYNCGVEYSGNEEPHPKRSWHYGECDICKKMLSVCQLRYFIKKDKE